MISVRRKRRQRGKRKAVRREALKTWEKLIAPPSPPSPPTNENYWKSFELGLPLQWHIARTGDIMDVFKQQYLGEWTTDERDGNTSK